MAIKYFGYGSNKDLDMMSHMVGNNELHGKPGKLLGYELCIQRIDQIRDIIPQDSPLDKSPRAVVREGFDENFELFVARPKKDSVIYGTIWDLTAEELNLVKEWELVDAGMQEEVQAIAIDDEGKTVGVETQAVIDPPAEIDRLVIDEDYDPYIVSKGKMLEVADRSREFILSLNKK
jgi:hypothetical protein